MSAMDDTQEALALTVNGEAMSVPAATTVAGLLRLLGIKPEQAAVERNGEVVPRRLHGEQALAAGDTVEVVTFVGGG